MNKKNITIHTKKSTYKYGLDCFQAKEILFSQLKPQQIIDELSNNNIAVNLDEIKELYDKTHHLQSIINIFADRYNIELSLLDDKGELFDTDALFNLFNNYILDNYYPDQLFDSDYIEILVSEYVEAKPKDKTQLLLNILRNVNGIAKYRKTTNLDAIFKENFFNIEDFIIDCSMSLLSNPIPKKDMIKIVHELKTYISTYALDKYDILYLYRNLIESLAKYGLREAQELFDYTLQLFPDDKQSLYLALLYGLDKPHDLDNMKKYYQKAISLMPISEEDQDNQKLIIEYFSYLKAVV